MRCVKKYKVLATLRKHKFTMHALDLFKKPKQDDVDIEMEKLTHFDPYQHHSGGL